MSAVTIHNADKAQPLPRQKKLQNIAFDGSRDELIVLSEQLNCRQGWLFGAHLQPHHVCQSLTWLALVGVSAQTARNISKKIFPNLQVITIPVTDNDIASILEQSGFVVNRCTWDYFLKYTHSEDVCGCESHDQKNILEFVRRCMGGWRNPGRVNENE